ncbi:hypothetical protein PHMEG_0001699 [Phytophthora megakarya]|uniref:DM2 domain-containing protein n=1 Tax=Phytophthora megakarya TaxID=4795 RepID=A0A225X271_9STRA|nr:hypothetical protein PHMEG_0001699 [Phytophthora megakarya]
MQAAVPATWRELYAAFSSLKNLRWGVCNSEGASSSLRALKSDNQEYEADTTATFLLRSGGHYWFSVLQAKIADATLGGDNTLKKSLIKSDALPFLQSPQQVTMGKWEKIRAVNNGPCPRRNHSMTSLPNALCARELMNMGDAVDGVDDDKFVNVRRILVFGGQSEGIPFEAFGDLYLLYYRWSTPSCNSTIPTGRSLHNVYRISDSEVIIYGGRQIRQSNGLLDIHKLKVLREMDTLGDTRYNIEWSEPRLSGSLPCSRRGHSTNSIGPTLLLFGGQDESTGQLENDIRVLNVPHQRWRHVDVPGQAPCPRRGFKNQFFGTTLVISSGFVRSSQVGKVDRQLPDNDLYKLSPSLSHLLGKNELTRPAAIKEFWAYVKEHKLQDPTDGRVIRPNQEMKDMFHVNEIGFTQVMGLLSKHLEKKPQQPKHP